MVAEAAPDFPRIERLRRLFDLGCAARRTLLFRALSLPLLFARDFWGIDASFIRTEARLVARDHALLTVVADSLGARFVPTHLLLLSRGILQVVLGRPAFVRSGRAAQDL